MQFSNFLMCYCVSDICAYAWLSLVQPHTCVQLLLKQMRTCPAQPLLGWNPKHHAHLCGWQWYNRTLCPGLIIKPTHMCAGIIWYPMWTHLPTQTNGRTSPYPPKNTPTLCRRFWWLTYVSHYSNMVVYGLSPLKSIHTTSLWPPQQQVQMRRLWGPHAIIYAFFSNFLMWIQEHLSFVSQIVRTYEIQIPSPS